MTDIPASVLRAVAEAIHLRMMQPYDDAHGSKAQPTGNPYRRHPMTEAAEAFDTLKRLMRDDPEYAWGWHCNLAMPIMDATNCSHQLANEAGAHLMQHLFDYDITTHPHYEHGKSLAQEYAELRIAAERAEDEAPHD